MRLPEENNDAPLWKFFVAMGLFLVLLFQLLMAVNALLVFVPAIYHFGPVFRHWFWAGLFLFTDAGIMSYFLMVWSNEPSQKSIDKKIEAAAKVSEIYFNIAAAEIGEDEVRKRRDEIINKI